MLYIVATPIGNLKEITYRAIEVLNSVEYIACEDTRTSKILLDHYDIKKPLKSYHKFNENKSSMDIINDLKNGKDIALISDAGMPGISDPGNIIVNHLIKENLSYTVISGPSAFVNAFVLSGFETPVTFVGFLPENNTKKNELLDSLSDVKSSLIFYCSPHSIVEDLKVLYNALGDRKIAVVREISKKFEEVNFSTLKDGYGGVVKGEFVVVIDKNLQKTDNNNVDNDLKTLLNMGLSKSDASKIVAKIHNLKKNDIYKSLNN
ncbi:MAG: 16S rRNA (cytidine(1402)-2'-O)-methyltransferase [Clostridiales bacterium]|nr:16S rRNA (cytidine(1402)-2'-O)-methyltransferase [Clostridiales bacterium]